MRMVNLALRFLLELSALVALAYWGARTGSSVAGRIALAVGAPLLAAAVWGTWVAPRAARRLPDPPRLVPEFAVWLAGAGALWASGHPVLGGALLVVAAVNRAAVSALGGDDLRPR